MVSVNIFHGSGLDFPLLFKQFKSFPQLIHQQHIDESQICTEARLLHSSLLYSIGCFIRTSKPMCSKWNSSLSKEEKKKRKTGSLVPRLLSSETQSIAQVNDLEVIWSPLLSVSTSPLPVPLNTCSNHFKTLFSTTTANLCYHHFWTIVNTFFIDLSMLVLPLQQFTLFHSRVIYKSSTFMCSTALRFIRSSTFWPLLSDSCALHSIQSGILSTFWEHHILSCPRCCDSYS